MGAEQHAHAEVPGPVLGAPHVRAADPEHLLGAEVEAGQLRLLPALARQPRLCRMATGKKIAQVYRNLNSL